MSTTLTALESLAREVDSAEIDSAPLDARLEALEEALASRVADYGLGLTVALLAEAEGIMLRVLSRDGSFDEIRAVADDAAMSAFVHPWGTFKDLPDPWVRTADDDGSADDDEADEADDSESGGGGLVERVSDYTDNPSTDNKGANNG